MLLSINQPIPSPRHWHPRLPLHNRARFLEIPSFLLGLLTYLLSFVVVAVVGTDVMHGYRVRESNVEDLS